MRLRDCASREYCFESFPQLEGVRFTHRWGGVMGMTTSRVTTFGSAAGSRAVWAAAHNGHGIDGSRFAAGVALAMLGIGDTDVLKLDLVDKPAKAWPPDPIRTLAIRATIRAIDSAQIRGREGPWLRLLTRLGMNAGGTSR